MKHVLFESNESNTYSTAILIKDNYLRQSELYTYYVHPLVKQGIDRNSIIAFSLKYLPSGKAPAKMAKEYLATLLKSLKALGTTSLFVCDSSYFKYLTKVKKTEGSLGYILPCAIKGYEDMNVILSYGYSVLMYNDAYEEKIKLSIDTLANHIKGSHTDLGSDVIHSEAYPKTIEDIKQHLDTLHQYDALTCDIEAFSLRFNEAGIGTISFAWDKHNGVAFSVDYYKHPKDFEGTFGLKGNNLDVKDLLRDFFINYKGKLIFHNLTYDIKILIYELFMEEYHDTEGLLKGLEVMCKNSTCSMLITFLATNTCPDNPLGLKGLAHTFTGDYAEDVKDISLVPLDRLLKYNLIDCLATWFVYEKNYPVMLQDNQEQVYLDVMLPSMKTIMYMELWGMPINLDVLEETRTTMEGYRSIALEGITGSPILDAVQLSLTNKAYEKDYQDRKGKAKNPDKIKYKDREGFPSTTFNPNSSVHLTTLLFDYLGFEVMVKTKTGLAATGGEVITGLYNQLINQYNITEEELL